MAAADELPQFAIKGKPSEFSMSISAIIPLFNRRSYIERAIDSVLAQTAPVDEILVVDDGSTDGGADFVEQRYGSLVRVIRQPNTGVSGARRRGILEATGEWIAFLDSDDEWTPDRNAQLTRAHAQAPGDVAWLFGNTLIINDTGASTNIFEECGLTVSDNPEVFRESLKLQFPFQVCILDASIVRRRVLLDLNCFAEGFRSHEDLLVGFQVACRYRFAAVPSIVTKAYRTSDLLATSLSANFGAGPEYHLARMRAFANVIQTGRRRPWNSYYAEHARSLCQLYAEQESPKNKLALQQFRYGSVSLKGVLFLCCSLAGPPGFKAWKLMAAARRRVLDAHPVSGKTPFPWFGHSRPACGK